MSRSSKNLHIEEASQPKVNQLRMPSGNKKRSKQKGNSSVREQASKDSDKYEEESNNNIPNLIGASTFDQQRAASARGESAKTRTPTPTKHVLLEAVRRKPGYQSESSDSSRQRTPPLVRPNSALRRTVTPTKQISLQAVRRKADNYSDFNSKDWKDFDLTDNNGVVFVNTETKPTQKSHQTSDNNSKMAASSGHASSSSLASTSSATSLATGSTASLATTNVSQKFVVEKGSQAKGSSEKKTADKNNAGAKNQPNVSDSDEYDTDLDDGDETSSDESDEEPTKAPNELFMEFLACVMQQDYKNAQKLCQMILLYEPNNPEALNFKPLIEYKVQRAEAGEETSSSDDEDSSETDSDEDDSENDDPSDDSGEESEENENDEDSTNENSENNDEDDEEVDEDEADSERVTDSGLGSVTDVTQ